MFKHHHPTVMFSLFTTLNLVNVSGASATELTPHLERTMTVSQNPRYGAEAGAETLPLSSVQLHRQRLPQGPWLTHDHLENKTSSYIRVVVEWRNNGRLMRRRVIDIPPRADYHLGWGDWRYPPKVVLVERAN